MEGAVRSETGIKQVMSDPRKCVCRVRAYVRACGRACARACSVRARGVCAYAVGVFDTFEIVFATRAHLLNACTLVTKNESERVLE